MRPKAESAKMQKCIEWFLKAGNGHRQVVSDYRYKDLYVNFAHKHKKLHRNLHRLNVMWVCT